MTVTVGGRAIQTREWEGDPARRPIVLLHEALGSISLWRDFPQQLQQATGRRVLAYERLGHGHSDPSPHVTRTRAFFEEEALETLPEVLTQLDAPEPILVGHSDGASIALVHGGHRPVTALVLMAPHVFVEQHCLQGIRDAATAYREHGLKEKLARHHADPDLSFWAWHDLWLADHFADWTLDHHADTVTAPTLVVQGEQDVYGTLEQIDRIHRRVAGPKERLVTDGGHQPHLEHADQVVAAITGFTNDLD